MAENKPKDNSYSTNSEVKRDKGYQNAVELKQEVNETIKDLLVSTTIDVLEKNGLDVLNTPTGTYATGKPYGYGAAEGKFQVKVAGKTNSSIVKQIVAGAKMYEAFLKINSENTTIIIQYQNSEASFFRGVEPLKGDKKTYLINDKIELSTNNMSTFKKDLKKFLTDLAEKEIKYIKNTKIGIEDRNDVGTTSIVDEGLLKNLTMKKMTLKEMFSMDQSDELDNEDLGNEEIKDLPSDEKNIDKMIDLNTQPIDDNQKGKNIKYLLFDDEEEEGELTTEPTLYESLKKYNVHNLDEEVFKNLFTSIMKKKYGTTQFEALTPVEQKDLVIEITTTGPAIAGSQGGFKDGAFSGSGGYNTKSVFKPVNMLKGKNKTKATKKQSQVEKAGAPYNIPAKDSIYESKLSHTSYGQLKNKKRPSFDKDYNIIKEGKESGNWNKDGFYESLGDVYDIPAFKVNHTVGIPTQANSKEEEQISREGSIGFGKLKTQQPTKETKNQEENKETPKVEKTNNEKKDNMFKKKFHSVAENEIKGINKRYLISEKTTEEYERERWSKLSGHKLYESILKEDELDEFVYTEEDMIEDDITVENYSNEDLSIISENTTLSEDTVLVEKPGSQFGTCFKFYKKDFINENKVYILDLNTMNFVPNPNIKK